LRPHHFAKPPFDVFESLHDFFGQPCPFSASRSLVSPRALVVRSVVSPRQPIAAACRCIDLMQAASQCAKLTAITAAEVFEMQDKDPQIQIPLASARHAAIVITAPPQTQSEILAWANSVEFDPKPT
jgi:hypothetical protein